LILKVRRRRTIFKRSLKGKGHQRRLYRKCERARDNMKKEKNVIDGGTKLLSHGAGDIQAS
jgi:hypothetical protein